MKDYTISMHYRFKPTSKYRNKITEIDGIKFSSRLEAHYYCLLKQWQKEKKVNFFLRQTPFHISATVTYRADFMVFYTDGLVQVVDIKGFETDTFKLKKKLVEEKYNIVIEVLKKKDLHF